MEDYISQLNTILSELFSTYARTITKPGVLLSGGIDSSLITYFVSHSFSSYSVLSMGAENTKDLKYVKIICDYLRSYYEWVELTKDKIIIALPMVRSILIKEHIPNSLMQVSLATGYFLIFEKAKKMGITHIITGQGPDILFAGYHKYKTCVNINNEIKSDLELLEVDKRRDSSIAKYFGITLINPYLEHQFVEFALSVPSKYKIHQGVEKLLLRLLAKKLGLPEEIINRPKKAFQYSTGIQNIIRRVM
ncbi:hypothetical protein COY87_02900 [Candidatus Roizmanbacteria bacterium CG_4_10_14_0_8_um_filter_33_9]|uniref:Asparagine synthetase domain-containing protein n=1 Tax=Candidatus Roizmanbacteria bacterium CG_4_10_14_0_8_um_filter_33_9 TaxID=1974826 RepID=A0A2M7QIE7_9BACT|nr:MAG: hypothetical protein COY87_02900 [Candidatus Roizmanbacteria bacterium CG_4_10_14_0_8_um_filter_33_9]